MLEASIQEVISYRESREDIREIKGVSVTWGFGSWTLFQLLREMPRRCKSPDFAGTPSQDLRHTEYSCESHTREVAGNKGLRTDRLNPFKFSFSLPSPFPLALIRALPPPPLSPKCLSAVSHPSGPWAERVIPPLCCSQRIKPAVLFHLHSLFPPNTCWAVERRYPQLVVPVETHVTLLLCLPRCSQGPPCWEALGEWEKS